MMPKGVEHKRLTLALALVAVLVKIPMMPKGVEHQMEGIFDVPPSKVKIPMMPKGVEHRIYEPRTPAEWFV